MSQKIDLTGRRFGSWTVLNADEKKNGHWVCKCDCGNVKSVSGGSLRFGDSKSCGCKAKEIHRKAFLHNLAGQRFGSWVVLYGPTQEYGKRTKWHCRCDCGTEKDVFAANLTRGLSTNCGCEQRRILSQLHKTHGKQDSRLFVVWRNMRQRCYSEKCVEYKNYGGRGIGVCNEWLGEDGYANFRKWAYENGYDENAPRGQCTIDRIDINGNYEPSNCRWVGTREQSRNRTDNHFITINGITKTLTDWAAEYGTTVSLVSERLKRGWQPDRALTEAPKKMSCAVEYNGQVHSYSEWARILGIKKKLFNTGCNTAGL